MFLNYISATLINQIAIKLVGFIVLRKRRTLQVALLVTIFIAQLTPEVLAGKVGDKGAASFTYDLGTYSDYYNIANITDGGAEMGSISIYDDGVYIYIWVGVWSKPYLAYGELDRDGDGVIDAKKYEVKNSGFMKGDKNKDGEIDKHDLKSDGVTIEGLGDPHGSEDSGYRWYVDSKVDDSPKKYRDPEIDVPSWTDVGMLEGPIVYIATIPIPSGETSFSIDIEVHASPPECQPFPTFVVPESPLGTLASITAMLIALALTTRANS
jgi:hypothetical protein